jgi:hypothetical protein
MGSPLTFPIGGPTKSAEGSSYSSTSKLALSCRRSLKKDRFHWTGPVRASGQLCGVCACTNRVRRLGLVHRIEYALWRFAIQREARAFEKSHCGLTKPAIRRSRRGWPTVIKLLGRRRTRPARLLCHGGRLAPRIEARGCRGRSSVRKNKPREKKCTPVARRRSLAHMPVPCVGVRHCCFRSLRKCDRAFIGGFGLCHSYKTLTFARSTDASVIRLAV